MTTPDRPDWWQPGMSANDIAIWEAADRAAAAAPEIQRGDAIAIELERVWLAPLRDRLKQEAAATKRRRPKSAA